MAPTTGSAQLSEPMHPSCRVWLRNAIMLDGAMGHVTLSGWRDKKNKRRMMMATKHSGQVAQAPPVSAGLFKDGC